MSTVVEPVAPARNGCARFEVVTASPTATSRFRRATTPDVSIILVTWGTGPVVLDALAALSRSLDARHTELTADVVVVDNAHPERGHRTADRISLATAGVRLVRVPANLGFGGGNDLGVDLGHSELLAFLNPDAIVPVGWLEPLVAEARRHPDHIVAPRLVRPDGVVDEAGVRVDQRGVTTRVADPPTSNGSAAPTERPKHDFASAACWVTTRRLYERLGGFDPVFHPAYFEDADLALRAERVGGGTTIVDDVDVVHRRGVSVDGPTDASAQGAAFRDR
ncbi:MAG: glycosyltransferase family 2 protein, partial [Actinomycetota bacterium]